MYIRAACHGGGIAQVLSEPEGESKRRKPKDRMSIGNDPETRQPVLHTATTTCPSQSPTFGHSSCSQLFTHPTGRPATSSASFFSLLTKRNSIL